jgi:hypothetical protein
MARSPQGAFSNLLRSLRPGQWTKNFFVFAALIFGRRLADPSSVGAALLAEGATGHRPILEEYTPYLLDQMIAVVTASTLIAYIFYAISPETAARFGTLLLGLTIPFPLYGIFRYLYLVHRKDEGGSPAELLLNDKPLLVCVALWAATVILIIYQPFGPTSGATL